MSYAEMIHVLCSWKAVVFHVLCSWEAVVFHALFCGGGGWKQWHGGDCTVYNVFLCGLFV